MILANVFGVVLPLLIEDDGVLPTAEMNILALTNYKEIDMSVWEPDDKEDLHTVSKRDVTVWIYFGRTIAFGIALFLVLDLFA
mgnify:CR=1 FL=1|tara:strand:+ start:432 stop:680 length:249 start_codon:yes stop_codon:yes gene_type:complete